MDPPKEHGHENVDAHLVTERSKSRSVAGDGPLYETGAPSGHLSEDAKGPTESGGRNRKRMGRRKAHRNEHEVA